MATSSVLYPQGVKFDMDYYLKTHMPLVQKHWGPEGLKSYQIIEMGDDAAYKVQAILFWGSEAEYKAATSGKAASTVFGDIPNFSDKQPVVISGPIVQQVST